MRVKIQIVEDNNKRFERPRVDKEADFAFLGHLKDNNIHVLSTYLQKQLIEWQDSDQEAASKDIFMYEAQNDEMIREFEYETSSNDRK